MNGSAERTIVSAILRSPVDALKASRLGVEPSMFNKSLYGRLFSTALDLSMAAGDATTRDDLSVAVGRSDRFSDVEIQAINQALSAAAAGTTNGLEKACDVMVTTDQALSARSIITNWQESFQVNRYQAGRDVGALSLVLTNLVQGLTLETGSPREAESGFDVTGALNAIPTGVKPLDWLLRVDEEIGGGFRQGELMMIGSPSGHGKTSTAAHFASSLAQRGHGVVVFELETDTAQFVHRCVCNIAEISLGKAMDKSRCTPNERDRRSEALSILEKHVRVFSTAFEASEMTVRVKASEQILQKKIDLVVVDHIGIMSPGKESRNEWQFLGDMAGRLKRDIAEPMGTTCVAFSQLPTDAEKYFIKHNTVQFLAFRGSGALKNWADVGIVAGRHNGKDDNGFPMSDFQNLSVWTVAKNRRMGRLGKFGVRYEPDYFRFGDKVEIE